jgi:hypothetical protein
MTYLYYLVYWKKIMTLECHPHRSVIHHSVEAERSDWIRIYSWNWMKWILRFERNPAACKATPAHNCDLCCPSRADSSARNLFCARSAVRTRKSDWQESHVSVCLKWDVRRSSRVLPERSGSSGTASHSFSGGDWGHRPSWLRFPWFSSGHSSKCEDSAPTAVFPEACAVTADEWCLMFRTW